MKNVVSIIIKVVVALAAVAGIVYLAATYGDRVVAWAKKTLGSRKHVEIVTDPDTDVACEADFVG